MTPNHDPIMEQPGQASTLSQPQTTLEENGASRFPKERQSPFALRLRHVLQQVGWWGRSS